MPHSYKAISILAFLLVGSLEAAVGDPALLGAGTGGDFALVQNGRPAPLAVSADDWAGVRRAAADLQADIVRVTGSEPELRRDTPSATPVAVLIGTVGHSSLIDGLVAAGRLRVDDIRGRWESFLIETIEHPLPGVDRALVIAGSDKRGTIYGIYELSQQIGVSPWYWWADVPAPHRAELWLRPGRWSDPGPVVKYRGIFLNDEAPDLTNWVRAKFGEVKPDANPHAPPGVANYGREFYTRLFEVMLRLRANYLWPAMWNNAFNEDDPENARLADEYGIVMGTSHQEPMLRAQKEWDWRFKATLGSWNYAKHPDVLENFWREGVRRNKDFESIVTLGLRGADDTEMAPGGPAANSALLEGIVARQRDILRAEVNPDLTKVPQLWCLYKEVQDFYDAGLRVPDDVTLLWAEDNWGNLRRLPTPEERRRQGGAGVYYHFDYHGGPRSYQWLNTSPLPKIWDQMSLARQYGADRIWIVNVGHFKGYELPTEFFLNLAWNPARWTGDTLGDFTRQWAAREFGPAHAAGIANILAQYAKYNGRRKPEMLAPDTYSLTHYGEAEKVVTDYQELADQAAKIMEALPQESRTAFWQLVAFPTRAGALVNELYLAAGRNALYTQQGRASAAAQAMEAERIFQEFRDLMKAWDEKLPQWQHFMDQPVLGYTTWRDPPENSLKHLTLARPAGPKEAGLGVAVEGNEAAWPGAAAVGPQLPGFDAFNRQRRYIDVFNRGETALSFTAMADAPWVVLSATGGLAGEDQRLWVSVDWSKVPGGQAKGAITITGAGASVVVAVEAFNPTEITRETLQGFIESNGCVAIESEHYFRNLAAGANRWARIADYGRILSGLRAEGPADVVATPGRDAPCLEYRMYLFTSGPAEVSAITGPGLNFIPGRPVRYAAAFDDEAPQVVTLVPADFKAQNRNPAWEKAVGDNTHTGRSRHQVAGPGYHSLKIWMIDPGVVLQKLVVDLGGVQPSYLGPPESYHSKGNP